MSEDAKVREKGQRRDEVLRRVFFKHFTEGEEEVVFTMDEIRDAISEVAALHPGYREKNVADVRYHFASGRGQMPTDVQAHGPWMFTGRGKGRYALIKLTQVAEVILPDLDPICVPDATPEIVAQYAGEDEQGMLAKIRYNRLLDVFLQITCYHLQNHWRTTIKGKGQCEIDDLYVGINTHGKQFVIPIEAKCADGRLSKAQIVQNIDFARSRYPQLIVRPVGVQEMIDGSMILIEFAPSDHPDNVTIREMRRYRLCPMDEVPLAALQAAE